MNSFYTCLKFSSIKWQSLWPGVNHVCATRLKEVSNLCPYNNIIQYWFFKKHSVGSQVMQKKKKVFTLQSVRMTLYNYGHLWAHICGTQAVSKRIYSYARSKCFIRTTGKDLGCSPTLWVQVLSFGLQTMYSMPETLSECTTLVEI